MNINNYHSSIRQRIEDIARKMSVTVEEVIEQAERGKLVELEHFYDDALLVALDHIEEKLDYYDRLSQVEMIKVTENFILKEYGVKEPVNTEKGKTEVSLIIGRFQPFHLGHKSLLEQMSHPAVLAVIRGKKTSEDKERNPFSFQTQRAAIMAIAPEVLAVEEFNTADVMFIVDKFRDYDLEVVELLCGSDRVEGYKRQADTYGPKINAKLTVKALVRDEDADDVSSISATKLREAIRSGDTKLINKFMGKIPNSLINRLQNEINQ